MDPVFLLTKEDWSSVAAGIKDIVSKPYIFCYFLGDSVKQRVAASEYASAKHLKIVTIPYMQMNYSSLSGINHPVDRIWCRKAVKKGNVHLLG